MWYKVPMGQGVCIAPSILSADFSKLGEEIQAIEKAGADYIHLDVMDGHFVPNMTIGPAVIESIRGVSKKPFDVHLMIEPVDNFVEVFAKAGADIITFHPEASNDSHKTIKLIKSMGKKVGIALNPDTSEDILNDFINDIDLVLVMTVNPGYGGQEFMPLTDKIKKVKEIIDKSNRDIDLEVDGGVNFNTAQQVIDAGANILVAGTAVFENGEYGEAIKSLRGKQI